jgi:hypothetical protein
LDVQELARTYTKEAVLTLVACLDDPRHKVAAAVALLDRGWGRPTQVIAGDEERPVSISFEWAPAALSAVATEADTGNGTRTAEPLVLEFEGC